MQALEKAVKPIEGDALPLEYELIYGRASRHLDLADVVNNTSAFRIVRIFGPGLEEEVPNLPGT